MSEQQRELASGNGWKLTQEDDAMRLELHSIYGIVEIKAKGISEKWMFVDIHRTFEHLRDLGAIEEMKHE